MMEKRMILSAATAGMFALAPAATRAANEEAAAPPVAGTESIQLSIVVAKGGG
jgi:hypothetical protein